MDILIQHSIAKSEPLT